MTPRAAASSFGIPALRRSRTPPARSSRSRRAEPSVISARPVTDFGSDAAPALVQPAEHACTRLRPSLLSRLRATRGAMSRCEIAMRAGSDLCLRTPRRLPAFAPRRSDAPAPLGRLRRHSLFSDSRQRSAAARRSSAVPARSPRFAPPAAPVFALSEHQVCRRRRPVVSRDAGLERNGPQREGRDRLVLRGSETRAHCPRWVMLRCTCYSGARPRTAIFRLRRVARGWHSPAQLNIAHR